MPEKKQSIFQPVLSELSTTTYSKQGVVDDSTAQAISAVGGTALAAHQGYQEAGLKAGIDKHINDFFTGIEAEQRIPGQSENVAQLAEQTAGLVSPEEDEALTSAKKDLAKLAIMRRTGAANPLQLRTRIEALTKQYISNMPGLADDFRRLARNELGDYSDRLKQIEVDEAAKASAGKDRAEVIKAAQKQATGFGIDTLSQPFSVWYPQLIEHNASVRTHGDAQRLRESNIIDKNRFLESNQWPAVAQGAALSYRTEASAIINLKKTADGREATAADKIAMLDALEAKQLLENGKWNPDAASASPKVTALNEAIKSTTAVYKQIADGTISNTEAQNRLNTLKAITESKIRETSGLGILMTASTLFPDSFTKGQIAQKAIPLIMNMHEKQLAEENPFGNPANRAASTTEAIPEYFKQLGTWAAGVNGSKEGTKNDAAGVLHAINTTLDTWKPNETTPAFDGLLGLVADPEINTFLSNHGTPELRAKLAVPIERFITDNVMSAFSGKYNTDTMRIVSTSTGGMYAQAKTNDPVVAEQVKVLNKNYLPRFEKYLKATAHLQETTNYSSGASSLISILDEKSKSAAVVEQRGLDASNYTKEDAGQLIKVIDAQGGSMFGGEATPETGALAGTKSLYIATPLDMLYGEDVNDFEVIIGHINSLAEGLYKTAPEVLDDLIAKLPHNKPWAIKARENAKRIKEGKKPQQEETK